jgi:hypothetical protein
VKKHKLYFTDDRGSFGGFDRIVLKTDLINGLLHVGRELKIPLRDIAAVELRPLPNAPNKSHLAIDFASPAIENGKPITLRLIHKDFLTRTKLAPMQAVVDELSPVINHNAAGNTLRNPDELLETGGILEAQYALNVSLLITYWRKLWYSYDRPKLIAIKTLGLMLLGGVVNVLGVLLVAVPFDNYRMSKNLTKIGWSKTAAQIAYFALTYPAIIFWFVVLIRWLTAKAD